jgi:hypothetical protein
MQTFQFNETPSIAAGQPNSLSWPRGALFTLDSHTQRNANRLPQNTLENAATQGLREDCRTMQGMSAVSEAFTVSRSWQ